MREPVVMEDDDDLYDEDMADYEEPRYQQNSRERVDDRLGAPPPQQEPSRPE